MSPATHFGKYLLIDKVGTGGMAELFMAKQTGLKGFEKVMAIKRILPYLTADGEFVSMFINEAKLAALLSHQNIVQIFDLGHIEGSYFIAMEYVMGKDLRTILQRAKVLNLPLSVGHALLIMSKVCAGLDYAHRKKDLSGRDLSIVHRDISPQNILVSYEGEVKVVDFGIAKAATQSSETRTGILKGKLSYMAPEQAWGKPVDRRTDIFAIGIVLYEVLTGHKLFKGDNEFNTLEKVREAKVEPPPTTLNKQVMPELEAIILKALTKEPENRFQSASELLTALEDHMSQKGYDFSTARLAQYLQNLFQHDIEQDTQRFMIASGANAAPAATGIAEQSTLIRGHRPTEEMMPSHPSRRYQVPAQTDRLAGRPSKGPSAFRIMIYTILLLLGGSVLISMINPPFLQRLSRSKPEVGMVVLRLSEWPGHILHQVNELFQAAKPAPDSTPVAPIEPPLQSAEATPPSAALPAETPSAERSSAAGPTPAEAAKAPEEAVEEPIRKLKPREKEEVRSLLEEAKTAYNERRLDDVERTLHRLIGLNPKIPMVYHLLGTVNLERKDPQGAIRIFEEASRKFPNYPLLHYDLGFLYFNQGVASLAQDELQKALALNPDSPMAGRARSAIEEIKQSPAKPPPAQSETSEMTETNP